MINYTPYEKRADTLIKELENIKEYNFPDNMPNVERCVIYLRKQQYSYKQIQQSLGMISKQSIRDILNRYDSSLIDLDCNRHKLTNKDKSSNTEKRIIGLLKKFNQYEFDLDEFDDCQFRIVEGRLYMTDGSKFGNFDERTQLSILYNIGNILGIDLKDNEYKK